MNDVAGINHGSSGDRRTGHAGHSFRVRLPGSGRTGVYTRPIQMVRKANFSIEAYLGRAPRTMGSHRVDEARCGRVTPLGPLRGA